MLPCVTYIKINLKIKLSNANKIVMLSQTQVIISSFDSLKQLKVLILPVHFNNDLKTVTGSRPIYKRSKVSQTSEPSVKSLNFYCDI